MRVVAYLAAVRRPALLRRNTVLLLVPLSLAVLYRGWHADVVPPLVTGTHTLAYAIAAFAVVGLAITLVLSVALNLIIDRRLARSELPIDIKSCLRSHAIWLEARVYRDLWDSLLARVSQRTQ
ncbi:hypothetical protein IP91_00336 [Pseudoduganella lurida]|uniref:Uncharacterized protein n=2 Tax=Pseudoduganella lurida TaxID=1036180 RepID=A0A562RJP4_9BURK|nr:hypothetical protein IP91_00336 [Pseudoduganella lurida]